MSHDVNPRPDEGLNPRDVQPKRSTWVEEEIDEPPVAMPSWSWMGLAGLCACGLALLYGIYGLAKLFVSLVNP